MIAMASAAYLLLVQRFSHLLNYGAKEISVGLLFAAGCASPVLTSLAAYRTLLPIASAACIFALNCLFISMWEAPLEGRKVFESLSPQATRSLLRSLASSLAVVTLGCSLFALLAGHEAQGAAYMAITISAALLCLIDRHGRETTFQRMGADVVLLTPLLYLWLT